MSHLSSLAKQSNNPEELKDFLTLSKQSQLLIFFLTGQELEEEN